MIQAQIIIIYICSRTSHVKCGVVFALMRQTPDNLAAIINYPCRGAITASFFYQLCDYIDTLYYTKKRRWCDEAKNVSIRREKYTHSENAGAYHAPKFVLYPHMAPSEATN